jgi:osmotically inducible protein OsmC
VVPRGRGPRATWIGVLALAALAAAYLGAGRSAAVPPEAWSAPDVTSTAGAIEFFERRLGEDPGNALLMANLAGRYMQRFQLAADVADVARAEDLARDLVARDPDPAAARARLASVLLARHAFAEALAEAEVAVANAPLAAGAWAVLFDAAFASGRYERAADALARLEPGSVTRRLKSAFWLEALGRAEAAAGELRIACARIATWSIPEQEAFCWTELGNIERARGERRAAAALYARALASAPGYRTAVEGLADLAYAGGDLDAAEALYRRIAVDAHPDLYLRLAELRCARGDSSGAKRWEGEFLRVATAPGGEPLYGRWLALLWAESPQTQDAALAVAGRDVARRPAVESWDALAWVLYLRGEPVEALAASDRATAWGAPSPTIAYHRGRIFEALGREREAAQWLDRAAERGYPLGSSVRRNIEEREEVMPQRKGSAEWKGGLKDGRGSLSLGSGAFEGSYSFGSRFEQGKGTNPEELIGAAHAACFSMALAAALGKAGHEPKRVSTTARVDLDMGEGPRISTITLETEAEVPGIDEDEFQQQAEGAKQNCPVSKALAGVEIRLDARLV